MQKDEQEITINSPLTFDDLMINNLLSIGYVSSILGSKQPKRQCTLAKSNEEYTWAFKASFSKVKNTLRAVLTMLPGEFKKSHTHLEMGT